MSEFFIADGSSIHFSVNDVRLGLVESYSVQTAYDAKILRAIGQSSAVAVLHSGQHHIVTVRRILPAHEDFLSELLSLKNFSFSVTRSGRGYHFTGCELLSHTWSCDSKNECLEEAKFCATMCIPMIVRESENG